MALPYVTYFNCLFSGAFDRGLKRQDCEQRQQPKKFGVDFDKAFSFEDPKKKYPKIKNEIWTVIQNESMRIGMTKEEAELSWGKPKEIVLNGSTEQWVYENFGTLTFKNGVVIKIDE